MNALFGAAVDVETFCAARGWRCSVIGGLAVQRWGEPRQTRDVDLTILAGLGREEQFVDPLLAHYRARIPDARRFALERRVLLVETAAAVPLDISLGGLPYEERVITRSTPFEFEPGARVTTCSAEDLVVLKAFAGRTQDWLDIEGVLVRQGRRLDRTLVIDELRPLLELKGDTEADEHLHALFKKHRS
jgi:Nucleotidyl transferase AbiEii toxin, Type IV TA system